MHKAQCRCALWTLARHNGHGRSPLSCVHLPGGLFSRGPASSPPAGPTSAFLARCTAYPPWVPRTVDIVMRRQGFRSQSGTRQSRARTWGRRLADASRSHVRDTLTRYADLGLKTRLGDVLNLTACASIARRPTDLAELTSSPASRIGYHAATRATTIAAADSRLDVATHAHMAQWASMGRLLRQAQAKQFFSLLDRLLGGPQGLRKILRPVAVSPADHHGTLVALTCRWQHSIYISSSKWQYQKKDPRSRTSLLRGGVPPWCIVCQRALDAFWQMKHQDCIRPAACQPRAGPNRLLQALKQGRRGGLGNPRQRSIIFALVAWSPQPNRPDWELAARLTASAGITRFPGAGAAVVGFVVPLFPSRRPSDLSTRVRPGRKSRLLVVCFF